jgi:hypothetical protein
MILSDMFNKKDSAPLVFADITISAQYEPWFIPWPITQQFRFRTETKSDGSLFWRAVPLND